MVWSIDARLLSGWTIMIKNTSRNIINYFVLWPTNRQLFHKLSHSYMFRHYRIILRELVINTLPSNTSISKAAVDMLIVNYTGCPTRYRTRHFFNNFTTNEDIAGGPLLRVATIRRTTYTHCRHIPLNFSHNERTAFQISLQYRHAGFGSEWDTLYYQQLHLKYLCNLGRYWLKAPWVWHDSIETCSSVIICEIIVYLLVTVQNNRRCTVQCIKIKKNMNYTTEKSVKGYKFCSSWKWMQIL